MFNFFFHGFVLPYSIYPTTKQKPEKASQGSLLPLLDTFRTLDWKKIREEIEPFRVMMGQKLLTVNT
ncbi:MAG: hypothetical protein COX89_01200 [Candidatus Nealsonbacteria bacterium CG_4_10_14_0_2_um_filter_37_10]|uniref:Uncharacterized protein n=1 Tax=Candidatus Nealsonbacteria bacterium CG_4_10_14_0_2_um_filter_37_10 TaxID=1974679 RepID=A0A2M7UZX1_9BACT|nr:MAG: hypothetical protein COX89_01200 [Candidatus Nealsonbacteria bacterium CG_4_10_14_0_2_um_filter_37_10]